MKKRFRKNQLVITGLALMIAIAGYVNYTRGNISDESAKEASTNISQDGYEISDDTILEGDIFTDEEGDAIETTATEENILTTEETNAPATEGTESTQTGEVIENPGEAVLTSSTVNNIDFAAEMKLNREQIRSKNKDTLLEIVNNTGLTDVQKEAAINQMIQMTDISEREAAAEMLLEAKGFTDVVVSITDQSADVVLNMGEVTDAKRAQVEDIVKRKTNVAAESIVITPIEVSE